MLSGTCISWAELHLCLQWAAWRHCWSGSQGMDWTASQSASKTSFFLSALSSALLSHFCLPMDKPAPSLQQAGRDVGAPGVGMEEAGVRGMPQDMEHSGSASSTSFSCHAAHFTPWPKARGLAVAQLWAEPLDMVRIEHTACHHALNTATLLKVRFKVHSWFLDWRRSVSYLCIFFPYFLESVFPFRIL